jgi:hypothetical protein
LSISASATTASAARICIEWVLLEVEAFLSYLAIERNVSVSMKNQAKAALLYL